MTLQEFFDKTYIHFSQPGAELSKQPDETCLYRMDTRADHPVRCAIGVHIPDEKYDPAMESWPVDGEGDGWSIQHILDHCGLSIELTEEQVKLVAKDNSSYHAESAPVEWALCRFQAQHDTAESVEECLSNMREFAVKYGLTIPKVV